MSDRLREARRRLALAARVPAHLRRVTWSAERIAAERQARLQDLLAVAKARSPWHRARLGAVDPATFREADLCGLPVMTKDDVMRHWDDVVTDPRLTLARARAHVDARDGTLLLGRYRPFATGGTTGRSGLFVWDEAAWQTALLVHVRTNLRARLRHPRTWLERPVVVSVVAEGEDHLSASMARAFEGSLVETHKFAVTHPLPDLVERLNRIRPTTLATYGSLLGELVVQAERGALRIHPAFVLTTSDPLLPGTRELLGRVWPEARLCNVWATTEIGPGAVGCGESAGMHLAEDVVIYETVDREGRLVPPGQAASRVLVTALFNHTMPLIRYELTDEVRLLPGACACASTHRRIADIQGRTDDAFRWGDVRVHPHLFRSPLSHETCVTQYQVRQTERGVEVLLQVDGPIDLERLRIYWVHRLRDQGLPDPEVSVRAVDDLQRGGAGKLRYFVPLTA